MSLSDQIEAKRLEREKRFIRNIEAAIFPPRPGSFAALMEMYEINYMQLRLLCGDIRSIRSTILLQPAGLGSALRVEPIEQSGHTSRLLLTYEFSDSFMPRPDLEVQIYHDSRQANVVSHRCKFLGSKVLNQPLNYDSQLLCQWRINRFLFKWAKYLRRLGYHPII